MRVAVVIPTFNEKDNILPLVAEIHHVLSGIDHHIVVVDDHSPDGTYARLCQSQDHRVKPILRAGRPSLAESIRMGIENAQGDIVIVMDSDFNHQPAYLPRMIKNLEFYDVVLGSRFLYGGAMDSRWRHGLSWIFNIFIRLVTGGKITDSLYGFIAIRREVIEKLDFNKIFWGYGDYCIRLVYYLQQGPWSILQVPVVNGRRLKGESNRRFLWVFGQYFWETIKLALRERVKSR